MRRASGVPVTVVFLTDGTQSHRGFVTASELRTRRRQEALDACRELGLEESAVVFLEFEDGQLARSESLAARRVADLVDLLRPVDLLATSIHDGQDDHVATARIARRAVEISSHKPTVFEFPIWYWNQWPYSPPPRLGRSKRAARAYLAYLARSAASLAAGLADRRWFEVRIGELLDTKWQALRSHDTQMTRQPGHPHWPVLSDVAGGALLDNLMRDSERFWSVGAPRPYAQSAARLTEGGH
jgi:LmbE family N-acetylglucosaminyl deacetylase